MDINTDRLDFALFVGLFARGVARGVTAIWGLNAGSVLNAVDTVIDARIIVIITVVIIICLSLLGGIIKATFTTLDLTPC